jgi:hypothetical protein
MYDYKVRMSTADTSGGGGVGGNVVSARDFVAQRLRHADSPMRPKELADEYGCTNGHVRNVLTDLRDEGAVARVERGLYTDADSAPDDADADDDAEPEIREEDRVELPVPAENGEDAENDEQGGDASEEDLPDQWQPDEQDDDQEAVEVEDDARDDQEEIVVDEETESSGIPLPVRKEYLAIGLIVVAVILYFQIDTSGSSPNQERAEESDDEIDIPGFDGKGLIDG